jgi:cytochrome oxidase Cu insertion factor (SCO1/SenC/PrrC family)
MPGMGHAPKTTNPLIVSAFHAALLHQGLVILAALFLAAVGWNVVRTAQYRRSIAAVGAGPAGDQGARHQGVPAVRAAIAEPPARRALRVAFGVLWLLDGLLQLQAAMPLGLPTNVLQPAASGSPGWVSRVVSVAVGIWERHPVTAAASVVWIQLGIGLLLLVAPRGPWSRAAGWLSAGWALVVWVFGEAFGGIFAPGASWLFGLPGAVLLYALAGGLLGLREGAWSDRRLGRRLLGGAGLFFLAMALLQAWPGRGFWRGGGGRAPGDLQAMLSQMASTPQPHLLASWVSAFGHFDAAHGWAVNLAVVVALATVGLALVVGRGKVLVGGVVLAVVVCLADEVLVEDMGIFGGNGTDPNSMLPLALLLVGGLLAWARPAVPLTEVLAPSDAAVGRGSRRLPVSSGHLARVGLALAAAAVVLVGAVPMAAASLNPHADPMVSEAADGTPTVVDLRAPGFDLVDQRGHPISLSSLRGRTLALTFLDPVCTNDCPLIAQEFKAADAMLTPAARRRVDFVAIVANPLYRSVPVVDAFDRQEGLSTLANWLFLTGSAAQLEHVWSEYGIEVAIEPAGAMVAHAELTFLIDAEGAERRVLDAAPAPGAASASSFAVLLTNQLQDVLRR